jgi:hypothetical protein
MEQSADIFQSKVAPFLAGSESHFLSINRGVTVKRANNNRALFVAVLGCSLSKYNELAPSTTTCRAKL